MTTITIERALLERWHNVLCYAAKSTGYDSVVEGSIAEISAALSAPATAPEQPAWHDAPICDGLWVRAPGYEIGFDLIHIAGNYVPPEGSRWFGPIPEDKP